MPTTTAPKSNAVTQTVTPAFAPAPKRPGGKVPSQARLVKWFSDIGIDDIPLVGGKNASLGEMYRELTPKGVKVPNGFAITAEAYRYFLRQAKLDEKIRNLLGDLDTRDIENLRQCGSQIRHAILAAELP